MKTTVRSLLDLDLYKLTMMQFAWKNYPRLRAQFQFKNRTDIDLKKYLTKEILDEEFAKIRELRFRIDEIDYLNNLGIFDLDYTASLIGYQLPEIHVTEDLDIYTDENTYWFAATLWETIVLSAVNELYYRYKYPNRNRLEDELEGLCTLRDHLNILDEYSIPQVVTDFGTRRRFSHDWQDKVIEHVSIDPSFLGTSNVYFAKKHGIKPIGTNAHEIYMIAAGYYDKDDISLKESHSIIMNQWYEMYDEPLSIGLTDTFGTDFFFEDFKDKADMWKGVRHDSGDPFEFGEKVIKYYEDLNIDPKEKLIVFSDGLDINKIVELYDTFKGRISISFGWGTKLTNNLGYETLSIVMKAVKVFRDSDTKYLVKLSDNLNKHTGRKEDIDRYQEVFNYSVTNREKLEV